MAVLSWFMSYTIMRMSTYDGVDVDFLSVDTNCRRTLSISLVICSDEKFSMYTARVTASLPTVTLSIVSPSAILVGHSLAACRHAACQP